MALKLNARLATAAGIAACIAGWMATGTLQVSGETETGEIAPPPPAVRIGSVAAPFPVRTLLVEAEERPRTLALRGRTMADAIVNVRAETTGRIVERLVDKGDVVAAGEVLCRLDPGAREALLAEAIAEAEKAELEFKAAEGLKGRGFESTNRVAAQRAALDSANAKVATARLELARTRILAPIDGIVEDPLAEVGDWLTVGQTCATLVDLDPISVTGQVSERDIALVTEGETVRAELVTGDVIDGFVRHVSRKADPETRTFTVEIDFPNPNGDFAEGITALAEIPLPPVRAHRLAPGHLVLDDAGRIGVRVVDENDRARFVPVTIADQGKDGIWVTGLPDTARVIVVGQDFVVDGQRVAPAATTERDDQTSEPKS